MITRYQAYYAACRAYEQNPCQETEDEMNFRLDMLNDAA